MTWYTWVKLEIYPEMTAKTARLVQRCSVGFPFQMKLAAYWAIKMTIVRFYDALDQDVWSIRSLLLNSETDEVLLPSWINHSLNASILTEIKLLKQFWSCVCHSCSAFLWKWLQQYQVPPVPIQLQYLWGLLKQNVYQSQLKICNTHENLPFEYWLKLSDLHLQGRSGHPRLL